MTHGLAIALRLVLTMAWSATYFVGCGEGDAPRGDAGSTDARGPHDAAYDGGGTAPPLAPCTDTSSCASAPGVACLTNIPGGSCTRRCTADSQCGTHGACVANICLWSCTSGGGECLRHAGACLPRMPGSTAYCVPICYPAGHEPPGYPACGGGLVCDPYTSTCVSSLATGADSGAPCRDSIECRGSACLIENDPAPTGFLGGMCISYGVEPNESAFVPGGRLPRGSCPEGSAVVPGFASSVPGDLVICLPTCVSDAGCRSGYACTHVEGTGRRFAEGLCLPIDCASAPCPSGSTCGTGSAWVGHRVCGRAP